MIEQEPSQTSTKTPPSTTKGSSLSRTTSPVTVSSKSVSISGTTPKSITRLEGKYKRYASESEMLFKTLSRVSEVVPAPEDFCDSGHLLVRNTESFRCLAQQMLSNSSLMKNRLFLFPPLEDPGIDLAFAFQEPPPENDDIGVEKYKKCCKELDIVPISRIIKSLETLTLNLRYYGLTQKQIKALTEAMKANAHVQNLLLEDNWLTLDMSQMVSDMLVENTCLQHVSLRECRLGIEGAQKLGEVLSSLQSLKSIDLSFNDLGDEGLLALQDGLSYNTSLKKLNLSHNRISEDSAETMEKILIENKFLEELDISWSGFYTAQGNKKLFAGFMNSDRIKILNFAWNGLGALPAVRPLTRYLKKSENLEEVDLSNNRLAGPSLRAVRTAMNKNHSLQIVKIGNNIYGPDEAHFLLTMLAGKAKDPLYYLDMDNMYVKKESKPVLNKIKNLGRTVKIGGILSNYEIRGPNPRKLIYERCRYLLNKPKKVKARKDFGHFILSLPETPISPEEFEKELKKLKMKKLDIDLKQGIMNLFMNKKKQIECADLVNDYMTFYPDTHLPPPKPKKPKKEKKGKRKAVEKEVQVHDLENEPVKQSTMSVTDQSQKSTQRIKSVTVVPTASRTEGDTFEKDNLDRKRSSTRAQGSKVHLEGETFEKDNLDRKRSSTVARGSKAHLEGETLENDNLDRKRSSTKAQGSKVHLAGMNPGTSESRLSRSTSMKQESKTNTGG